MPAVPETALSCPRCHHPKSDDPGQQFCARCGLVLFQPCPTCREPVETPSGTFTACPTCQSDYWSCPACGRLYHTDRLTCSNSYCPEQGNFWTAGFGEDRWCPLSSARDQLGSSGKNELPIPAWRTSAQAPDGDRRWSPVHSQGLLISVLSSGIVELWAERGAPHLSEGDEFRETPVRLTVLDLGEEASAPPFLWGQRVLIPGKTRIAHLDLDSNPSLFPLLTLPPRTRLLNTLLFEDSLLLWTELGLHFHTDPGAQELLPPALHLDHGPHIGPCSDGKCRALLVAHNEGRPGILLVEGQRDPRWINLPSLEHPLRWTLWADRFCLFSEREFVYLSDEESLEVVPLPDSLLTEPIYCPTLGRIILFFADHSVRSCSPTGDRVSFVCEMVGTPSTTPLKIGKHLYYGTEGRYLCRDEESLRPRLPAVPWGELSYANGRLFGGTRRGELYAFEL